MKIYESSVKHPVTTIMLFVGVLVLGLFSYNKLSIDLMPEIEFNRVMVLTTYTGASAEDVENNVTRIIENALSTVSDVKKISSSSSDNISSVSLEFRWGVNLDNAINDMRDKLEFVKQFLPEGSTTPTIFKLSTDMIPIMMLSVNATESTPALYKILDNKISNPLSRIKGVGSVSIQGAPQREIQVNIDPQKLEAYHLPLEKIGQAIAAENINVPTGVMDLGSHTYAIRAEGRLTDSRQLTNIIVGSFQGKDIYLQDVATVKDTLQERSTENYTFGRRGAILSIMKQTGANSVAIAKEVKSKLDVLKKDLPSDIQLDVVFDSSQNIQKSINSLAETVLLACLFVIVVILFFLGRWRATIVVIITIPISLIASFIYLMISGSTINVISLSSLSIAIGMVVDDAIVVLENISKHIERGSKPRDAAIYATNEVFSAVIASTMTIVAVFMPFTMMTGMAGIMFRQMGWMVSIIIVLSAITGLTLIPMMSAHLLRENDSNSSIARKIYRPIAAFLDRLDLAYEKLLRWSLQRKTLTLIISAGIFVGSLFLIPSIGTDFIPSTDNGLIQATVELPVGTRVDYARQFANSYQEMARKKYPEMRNISYLLGQDGGSKGGSNNFQATGTHLISFYFKLTDLNQRHRSIFTIADSIREDFKHYPELAKFVVTTGNKNMGGGSAVEVIIAGDDFLQTDSVAVNLKEKMDKIGGLKDIRISRDTYKPQYRLIFDRNKLAQGGITLATASQYVRNRINGMVASIYREEGEEYDIVVRYAPEYRTSLQDIENIQLYTPTGKSLRLGDLAHVQESETPPMIERLNRERIVKITGNISGRALSEIMKEVKTAVSQLNCPSEIDISYGGTFEEQQDTFSDVILLALLCLLLVYIVMACQFESLRSPFIIMFSLPFALSGVLLALFITQSTLNLLSLLGCVMLIGIVVKNGIVLVDYINLNRERGMTVVRAVISGGKSRLRPVLMTAMTTILGMVPLALGIGEGSELWQPMGISIIGGLTFSTLLTLIVVPVIYSLFGASKLQTKRKLNRKNQS